MHTKATISTNNTNKRHHLSFCFPKANQNGLAYDLAEFIASQKLSGNQSHLTSWLNRRNGTSTNSPQLKKILEAFFRDFLGHPPKVVPKNQLQGAVAHFLWYAIYSKYFQSTIINLEPPGFSTLDGGGDSIEFHNYVTPNSARLWELKKEETGGRIQATTSKACRQLNSRALDYIARIVGSAAQEPNIQVKNIKTTLADKWVSSSNDIGIGIGITSIDSVNHFIDTQNVGKAFPSLARPDQKISIFIGVEDFAKFCELVKGEIWNGI